MVPEEETSPEPLFAENMFEEYPEDFAPEEGTGETAEADIPEADIPEAEPPEEESPEAGSFPEALPVNPVPDATQSAPTPRVPGPDKPEAEAPAERSGMLDLMRYLKGLAEALPGEKRDTFMKSDARLGMEYIIDTLEGRRGLFREIKERVPQTVSRSKENSDAADGPKPQAVADTLTYLEGLATTLADPQLSAAIVRKVDTVITGIRQATPEN
jgi:hypothetical protein